MGKQNIQAKKVYDKGKVRTKFKSPVIQKLDNNLVTQRRYL